MKKDKDNKKQKVVKTQHQEIDISKTGKKIIFVSVLTLIIGFFLLKFTNPEGNNWASIVSPVVIILSYVFIAVGILVK